MESIIYPYDPSVSITIPSIIPLLHASWGRVRDPRPDLHRERLRIWRDAWAEARGGGSPDVTEALADLAEAHTWDVLDLWAALSRPGVSQEETHWYFSVLGDIAMGAWQYDLSEGSRWIPKRGSPDE
jgi:hypothetical protein